MGRMGLLEVQKQKRAAHLKSGALALIVGAMEAVVIRMATSRFSSAEFIFAILLTYTIAFGVFSKGRELPGRPTVAEKTGNPM
jgi:hypothetical protein